MSIDWSNGQSGKNAIRWQDDVGMGYFVSIFDYDFVVCITVRYIQTI